MENKKLKLTSIVISVLILTTFLVSYVISLSFSSSPSISPSSPVTGNSLNCSWTVTAAGTLVANVTWWNGTTQFANETNISCTTDTLCTTPSGINGSNIYRGYNWSCDVLINNGSANLTSNVTINITNADPVITNPLANVTLYEDQPYSDTATATDIEDDTLSWLSTDLNFSPDLFTIGSSTGVISVTPDVDDVGNHTFDIVVLDGNDGSDTVRLTYEVVAVNDLPYFSPSLSNQTASEDVVFYYIVNGTDEEGDTINFSLNASSLANLTITWINSTSANISFTGNGGAPHAGNAGNHTVNVTVYEVDNVTQNTSVEINLEITETNDAPVLATIPNATGTQGNNFSLQINATDPDTGDTVTFAISTNCSLNNPWNITTTVGDGDNASGWINVTLNNSNVVCDWVNVSVSDGSLIDWQWVQFNITNTNDAPELFEISTHSINSVGNNASNLTGYIGVPFDYRVNGSDIDNLTSEGETTTFTTNDSNFSINSITGLISIDLNDSLVGNHTVLVTLADDGGLNDTLNLSIEVRNNSIPVLESIGNQSCAEDVLCNITINASDADPNDNLTFTSNNTAVFNLTYVNDTTVRVLFTPTQSQVGNYSINVSVADNFSASAEELFNFEINNTNDAPFFDMDQDDVADNITFGNVIENRQFTYEVNVTDYDLDISVGEVLTFSYTVVSGTNLTLFNMYKTGNNVALVNFTPDDDDSGEYYVNVSVQDAAGVIDWEYVNFTIYNESSTPEFDYISPYYNTTTNTTVYGELVDASTYSNNIANVNDTENITVNFDLNVSDNDTALSNISLRWYVDGTLNTSQNVSLVTNFNYTFNFFSSGTRNVTAVLEDNFFANNSFTWNFTIEDNNRPPELLNNLFNFTDTRAINTTTTYSNYFSLSNGSQRFYDPDDDTDGDSEISGGETFSLTVTATSCSVATLTISGDDITIEPSQVGICLVNFTATDSASASVISNEVRIQVTSVPEGSTVVTSSSGGSGGGGGGGSSEVSRRVPIPRDRDVEVPTGIEVVVPGRVIIYEGRDMVVPVVVKNSWTNTLNGITLSAFTNNTFVNMTLSRSFFPALEPDTEEMVELVIQNYREDGPYEIFVQANVTDPNFTDTGTIFINSLEQTSEGDEVETKLTFAKDLFSENIECQELNELLTKAEDANVNRDYASALNILDAAINGCKYLLNSIAEAEEQNPEKISLVFVEVEQRTGLIAAIALALLTFVGVIALIFVKRKDLPDF